jgi:hypothetical protein
MQSEFWSLCDYDGVEVHDPQALLGEQTSHMLQKTQAMRIFPPWIRIRKMRANITETRRAQERIADCVRQRVPVGVAHRPFFKRDLNAAKY